jgi:DNA-binding protein HU-beta
VQRKARTGRNPRTGKEISIPSKASVKFSPAAAVKEQLNPLKK